MTKFNIKETPLKAKAPGLIKFKTEERLVEYLKEQYWDQGKSYAEIAKGCGVSESRIFEFFKQFHIRSRPSGDNLRRKPR